jgi:diguanylate cyclase (GGDEF)-like protein/PAS domain S-box-containing protein
MFEIKHKINQQSRPNDESQLSPKVWVQAQQLMQSSFQIISDAIIITDASGRVQFLNPIAENLTGWRSEEAQALPLSDIFPILDERELTPLKIFTEGNLAEKYLDNRPNRAILMPQDGSSFLLEYSVVSVPETDWEIAGVILVFRETNNSSKNLLNLDVLTGLINRHSFEQLLEQAISSAKLLDEQHILCYLDLDRFKVINETCGHLAGDELLRQVSGIFRKRVRKTDILARLGSDEFGLILCHCSLEEALKVLQILRQEIEEIQFIWGDRTFNFSISIGVVIINRDSDNSSRMLSIVNSACDVAKNNGRNRIHIYQPNDLEIVNQREEMEWIPCIFKALQQDRFMLYYQPIISLVDSQKQGQTNQSKSCEVLLRLEGEDGNIVPPGCFIPIAEKYGLMHLIDRWVIRKLFSQIGNSLENAKEIIYAVNISGASLNDDQFLNFVQEQFLLYCVPPEIICFEITETLAISNLNKAGKFIRHLKSIGCHFALDDFGSGMSSFGYLKSLPIDFLKIDGLFVKDMIDSTIACEIVEAINRIAHVMEIETVAEHVENNEILSKLKCLGIDYAQGYAIARPSPLQSF